MRSLLYSLMWLTVWIGDATCLAINNESSRGKRIRSVTSIKTDGGGHSKTFYFEQDDALVAATKKKRRLLDVTFIKQGLRSTFLPLGYPHKTPPGYLPYSVASWVQDVSTQLRAVLATQRILEGVGVGREGATALSALMNFLVRDGCGMAASLLFTSLKSSQFSADVKRWRLFADCMVDIGITLEVAATLVPPSLFLPMISVGNMCKAICGVAAGACGGAINLHWSQGSDISDIQAKFGAQHTVTGSLGLVFAALFARSVSSLPPKSLWSLYGSLTLLHIVANMQCMKLIAFDSLNTVRIDMVIASFLENPEEPLPTPTAVAKKEPLFFSSRARHAWKCPILFGLSFNDLSKHCQKSPQDMQILADQVSTAGYVVTAGTTKRKRPCVLVALAEDLDNTEKAKAYLHAVLLSQQVQEMSFAEAEEAAEKILDQQWPKLELACKKAGWDLSKTEPRTLGYEITTETV